MAFEVISDDVINPGNGAESIPVHAGEQIVVDLAEAEVFKFIGSFAEV